MLSQRRSIAVLDANAFISMSNIRNLSANHRIVTTSDVLGELKDLKTKQFVQSLAFEIEIKDCDDKALDFVKDFAKKTGDIASLSRVDMELIAVTYMLYQQEGLEGTLRKHPPPILEKNDLRDIVEEAELSQTQYSDQSQQEDTKPQSIQSKVPVLTQSVHQKIEQKVQTVSQKAPKQQKKEEKKTIQQNNIEQNKEQQQWTVVPVKPKRKVSSSSSESQGESGWITSKNYERKMAEIASSSKQQIPQVEKSFGIWMVSGDYAIQNVVVQMGMSLLSLDCRRISSIRRFIYECYLCWKKYRIQDEKVRLCNNCGYNSLSKIAYSIDDKGVMVLHRKRGWRPNKKITEVKDKKLEEQERRKKHQHARRKKKPSIFQN